MMDLGLWAGWFPLYAFSSCVGTCLSGIFPLARDTPACSHRRLAFKALWYGRLGPLLVCSRERARLVKQAILLEGEYYIIMNEPLLCNSRIQYDASI